MGCLGNSKTEDQRNEEKAQREANKKIEKQLQKDKQVYRATHRLLLLGKGAAGSAAPGQRAGAYGFKEGGAGSKIVTGEVEKMFVRLIISKYFKVAF
uniref:GNAS complex locus n=1 Tax=Strix occidentalis caurina TaxID=311401 RepID=A0A8D0FCW4_STROC